MMKDATGLAQDIRAGRLDSEELVASCLKAIQDLNPAYQAVSHVFEEEALTQARQMVQDDRPFAGVPIVLKDAGHTLKGKPSTLGSRLLANRVAQETASFTRQVKQAGFIVIGQTNVPEFALKFVSDSPLFGPVKNPVNPNYHAGGSSGGAATAVQKGMAPIATASDGGGSIRIPASFSGLLGLKPSRGRTPTGPHTYRNWAGAAVDFAMTQTIRDTWRLLLALQQEDFDPMPFQLPKLKERQLDQVSLKGLRLAYTSRSPHGSEVSDEAIQAVEGVVRFLTDRGFNVEEAYPSFDGSRILRGYYQMNGVEQAKSLRQMEQSLGRSIQQGEIEDTSRMLAAYGQRLPAYLYSSVLDDWDQLSRQFYDFHQTYDILIQPTTAFPAPPLDQELFNHSQLESISSFEEWKDQDLEDLVLHSFGSGSTHSPFAYIYNLTGQPALSLPLHTTRNQLPLGVMFSARKAREDLLLALGHYLESNHQFHYYP